jgi:hypothetical protein
MAQDRLRGGALLLLLAFACNGCMQFLHPVSPLPVEEVLETTQTPQPCKNRVYVFFVHGVDPFDMANLSGTHDYIRSLGFIKTYYGMPFHTFAFEEEIRRIVQEDAEARIVLIGFSYGANMIRDLACTLAVHHIHIPLAIYIDGFEFSGRPLHRPHNVGRLINILSSKRPEDKAIEEGENYRYGDVWHYGTVADPRTLRLIAQELGNVALSVPIVQVLPGPDPATPGLPPQRLLPPRPLNGPQDAWDLLQPDAHSLGIDPRKPFLEAQGIPPATLVEPRGSR